MNRHMELTRQTLMYLFRGEGPARQVLLGHKLRGFGLDKVMGVGGHVEAGESNLQAAVRETSEETGLIVAESDADQRATLIYRFPRRPALDAQVAVFVARAWSGQAVASNELRPAWFPVVELPLDRMWDDEQYWLPRILDGESLKAEFVFDDPCEKVIRLDVTVDPSR